MAERIFHIVTQQNQIYSIKCPKFQLKKLIQNQIREVQNIPADQIVIIDIDKNAVFDCYRGGFETQIDIQAIKQLKLSDVNILYKENVASKIMIEELRKIIDLKDNELQLINGKYKILEEEKKNQIANLQKESQSSKDQIVNQLSSTIESKNKEIQEFEKHVAIQTQEIQNLNKTITEQLNLMKEQKKNFEEQELQLKKEIENQESNLIKMQQVNQNLQTQLSECLQSYDQIKQQFSKNVEIYYTKNQEAFNENTKMQSDFNTQADILKKEIENLQKKITEIENEKELEIGKLKADIELEKSSQKILQKEITQLKIDIAELEQKPSKQFQQIPQIQKQQQQQPQHQQFNQQIQQSQGFQQNKY